MWLERLQNIDRRVIYTVLLIVLLTPMIKPIGIPLTVNQTTHQVYNLIESLDPNTDIVMIGMDYSVAGAADVHPQAVAVAKHLANRGGKMVMAAFVPDGPMLAERILGILGDRVTYGEDIVNLGYLAGGESAVKKFIDDPANTFARDHRGNPISSLPIMNNIKTIHDFTLIIDFQTGSPGYQDFLRQLPSDGPLYAVGIVTVSVPNVMPYLHSGQFAGLLPGLRGGAEYEVLIGEPGEGAARMDAQSLGHLVIVTFIIVGNVAYFLSKQQEKSRKK
ncbi:MAG: hypothetical protein GX033_04050 [Firmicutes bacterium]|nr:hypothetical protein [Bacillota bacterium]